jgi:hypothetical protein
VERRGARWTSAPDVVPVEALDVSGLLDERWDAIPDLVRARALPSMQLVGARSR